MTRNGLIYLLVLGNLLAGQISAQTDFDARSMNHPGVYQGVSEPKATEAEALVDARERGIREVAAGIASYVTGKSDIRMIAQGTDSADVVITSIGEYSVTVRLPLTGVEEIERKLEKTSEGYIARILLRLTEAGREKAEKYVSREAVAFRAYHYFAKLHNMEPLTLTDVPKGYSDFSSWLDSNCFVFAMQSGGSEYLNQLETFLKKFYRSIAVFAERLDDKPVRIIYGLPDYVNEIVQALQKMGIKVYREGLRLLLAPNVSLQEFTTRTEKMPDASRLVISGVIISGFPGDSFTHISSLELNEAAARITKQFGMNTQVSRLPEQCLTGTYTDIEILNMVDRQTARYVVLLKRHIGLEPGMVIYNIPSYYLISYQCVLFDSLTGKTAYSKTIYDIGLSNSGERRRVPTDFSEMLNSVLEGL